jgi:branched-chain amino acid transport system ATP-binding protein
MADDILLQANGVTIRFGGLTAVSDFNLAIRPHELVGLIGPNGAGKTTIFNMLTGVYKPTEGSINVGGRTRSPAWDWRVRFRTSACSRTSRFWTT